MHFNWVLAYLRDKDYLCGVVQDTDDMECMTRKFIYEYSKFGLDVSVNKTH